MRLGTVVVMLLLVAVAVLAWLELGGRIDLLPGGPGRHVELPRHRIEVPDPFGD